MSTVSESIALAVSFCEPRTVLRPRAARARIPDSTVRRIRALKLMGLRIREIAAICELSEDAAAGYALYHRRPGAGAPSEREILQAATIVARRAIENL